MDVARVRTTFALVKPGLATLDVPVDTTSSDLRQYGGERSEVIPSLDEVAAWLEASLLDPSEGETEVPTHVGRWRQQKGPDEPQAAVEKERIDEYQLQRDAIPTATPRAGALQGVVPLHQRQSRACSVQGWRPSRQMRCLTMSWRPSARKRWPCPDCCKTAQGRETPLETTRPSLTGSSTNFHGPLVRRSPLLGQK